MGGIEWYNYIARRNGGYRVNVPYEVVGESAEDVFEKELTALIRGKTVLDAGCGHGEFTLSMARHAKEITGYDFAHEMIRIADGLKAKSNSDGGADSKNRAPYGDSARNPYITNVKFLLTAHGERLSFRDGHFDVIYSRRGPGSIVEQSGLLKPGGVITGIHVYPIRDGEIVDRIRRTGDYTDITVRVFQSAVTYLRSEADFAEYLSSWHGAPDYTLPENRAAFEAILGGSIIDGRIGVRESKQIWRATRK